MPNSKTPLEQLDDLTAGLIRLGPADPEWGTPIDTSNRETFTICEVALLCSGRELREGGIFDGDLTALLEIDGGPNDAYAYGRDLRDALIRAVAADEFEIIPRYMGERIDPELTEIPLGQLIPWLTKKGVRSAPLLPEAPTNGGGGSETGFDAGMLATRDQLIEVFGVFTGMNMQWFGNLKDTPALLKARKLAGQGGRGHIREPYFCPFEVMQWLADPKRKKGRPLSETKGWELLKKHFPRAYARREVADPRE